MKTIISVIAALLLLSSSCFVYDCCKVYADTNNMCSSAVGKRLVELESAFTSLDASKKIEQISAERAVVKMGSAGQCEFEIKNGVVREYFIYVSNKPLSEVSGGSSIQQSRASHG